MKIFEKKQKFLDRYFQGSLRPQERLWSRTIIFFLHGESLLRTTQKYHLEGPESRRWASTAFWFACESQKCEKYEKSGNFKISDFLRPDWPFIMSDHLILMYLKGHGVFTKFWDANCVFHHGQSKNSLLEVCQGILVVSGRKKSKYYFIHSLIYKMSWCLNFVRE